MGKHEPKCAAGCGATVQNVGQTCNSCRVKGK